MTNLSIEFQIHLLAQSSVQPIAQSSDQSNSALINTTFEALAEQLQSFDRMYFEMDGSFVWTGATPEPWQLDGMVYDLGDQIQRIELKGRCPHAQWEMLLRALNHPHQPLVAYNLLTAQFATIEHLESTLWSS